MPKVNQHTRHSRNGDRDSSSAASMPDLRLHKSDSCDTAFGTSSSRRRAVSRLLSPPRGPADQARAGDGRARPPRPPLRLTVLQSPMPQTAGRAALTTAVADAAHSRAGGAHNGAARATVQLRARRRRGRRGRRRPRRRRARNAVRSPAALAQLYLAGGTFEIAFPVVMRFRACLVADLPMLAPLRAVSRSVFVPLPMDGGIRALKDPASRRRVEAVGIAVAWLRASAGNVGVGYEDIAAGERFWARRIGRGGGGGGVP
jgi:hypothetical protein